MSKYLNHASNNMIWQVFHEELLAQSSNVTNLDKLGAGVQLGILEYEGPESIESIKRSVYILAQAGLIAKLSEDGCSTIVTIPAGWSLDKLEAISQVAIAAEIPSANIDYGIESYKTVLRNNPIGKTQTIVLSNTVIKNSRNKSITDQKVLLKAKGLEEEFPDALLVLTAAVLTRIVTRGQKSLYGMVSEDRWTYTRTNKKTPEGWTLCVGSAPAYVRVFPYNFFGRDGVGVGGLRKFVALGP